MIENFSGMFSYHSLWKISDWKCDMSLSKWSELFGQLNGYCVVEEVPSDPILTVLRSPFSLVYQPGYCRLLSSKPWTFMWSLSANKYIEEHVKTLRQVWFSKKKSKSKPSWVKMSQIQKTKYIYSPHSSLKVGCPTAQCIDCKKPALRTGQP